MLGEIIDLARQKRMCLDYFTELKDCKNIDLAIPLYLKNPNWSLENKFLSLTFIRKYLSNKTKQGIYVDYNFDNELLKEESAEQCKLAKAHLLRLLIDGRCPK